MIICLVVLVQKGKLVVVWKGVNMPILVIDLFEESDVEVMDACSIKEPYLSLELSLLKFVKLLLDSCLVNLIGNA